MKLLFTPASLFSIPMICHTTNSVYSRSTVAMIELTCRFNSSHGCCATDTSCWSTTYHWYALTSAISFTVAIMSTADSCETRNHSVVTRMIEWYRKASLCCSEREKCLMASCTSEIALAVNVAGRHYPDRCAEYTRS